MKKIYKSNKKINEMINGVNNLLATEGKSTSYEEIAQSEECTKLENENTYYSAKKAQHNAVMNILSFMLIDELKKANSRRMELLEEIEEVEETQIDTKEETKKENTQGENMTNDKMENTKALINTIQKNNGTLNPNQIISFAWMRFSDTMVNAINTAVLNEYDEEFNFNDEQDIENRACAIVLYLEQNYNGMDCLRDLQDYENATPLAKELNNMNL